MNATIAYIAGFFDGEGSILLSKEGTRIRLELTVSQIDPRPLDFIAREFGGKVKFSANLARRPNARPIYSIRLRGDSAEKMIRGMLPFLIVKQEQARIAIKFRETISKTKGKCLQDNIVELRSSYRHAIAASRAALIPHPLLSKSC